MPFTVVDAADVPAGRGPHPAASPFDKRISEHLGVRAFEVYQVELPPGGLTEGHTHVDDGVEDAYAIIHGEGWVVVEGQRTEVAPGQFVAVDLESTRYVEAGPGGLTLIAICAAP